MTAVPGIILLGLCSCGQKHMAESYASIADTLTHHSTLLTIADHGNGVVRVDISSPGNSDAFLGRYALVDKNLTMPDSFPADVKIIPVPVERAAVFSAVHTAAIEELGASEAIAAVADGRYFAEGEKIKDAIDRGNIVDVGNSDSPSAELLLASRSQVVLRSPGDGTTTLLPSAMVPVEMADYFETSPIGRAEWILLLGELFGKRDVARSIFTDVIDRYNDLTLNVYLSARNHPKVLTETEQSGIWYVPAGQSYMARMLADAGAAYPWLDTTGTGSLPLSFEAVFEKAHDADFWLVRTYGKQVNSENITSLNKRYGDIKAVKDGNVYGCDTALKTFYNDIAFHPELILADFVAILHPEILPEYKLKYFSK